VKDELDISGLIRRFRLRTGLTQERLAAKLGVAFPTLNRWENGRSHPSPLALKRIEQCLRELGTEGQDLLQGFVAVSKSPGPGQAVPYTDREPREESSER
jgi:putative transcriptional regulator